MTPKPETGEAVIRATALRLAKADGVIRGNTYAETAYKAGVDMAIEYWNALALAAFSTPTPRNADNG